MKCPKCGYNSFEFLDACKKCGNEFSSFKKAHRISPVLFQSGAAPDTPPPDRLTVVAAAAPVEPPPPEMEKDFSWDVPGTAPSPQPTESPSNGFSLDFVDLTPAETKDLEFGGFSFDEPEPDPAPAEMPVEAFSFDEPAEQEPAAFSWDTPDDEAGLEMEKYQLMLEPEDMGETATDQAGESATGDHDYFGTSDFTFAPEQATGDILLQGASTAASKPSKKGGQPELENFDKEFEMIFSLEDKEESEEKNDH